MAEYYYGKQALVYARKDWCNVNDMYVKSDKSKIMLLQPVTSGVADLTLKCGLGGQRLLTDVLILVFY